MPNQVKTSISRAHSARCAMQHFGAWAIEPKWFSNAMHSIQNGTLKPLAFDFDDDDLDLDDQGGEPDYTVQNGVAIISIDGQMTKRGSSFGGASTIATRQSIRSAASDGAVRAIMLKVSSPGGTCAGTSDLAQDVATVSEDKPVYCYIEDLGCSAAYWVASQCDYIYANDTAIVGSIGTLMMLVDDTGAQDQIGIKWEAISTGDYKGLGADGAVTDKLRADVQREVNELNAPFLAGVQTGRGSKIKDITSVADGRVHVGAQALTLGLIDEIASFDAAMQAITNEVQTMNEQEFNAYASANPAAVQKFRDEGVETGRKLGIAEGAKNEQERFKALAEKFGAKRPGFVVEQYAKGHDVPKASIELADVLMSENEKLQQQIATNAPPSTEKERPTAQPIATDFQQQKEDKSAADEGEKQGKAYAEKLLRSRGLK